MLAPRTNFRIFLVALTLCVAVGWNTGRFHGEGDIPRPRGEAGDGAEETLVTLEARSAASAPSAKEILCGELFRTRLRALLPEPEETRPARKGNASAKTKGAGDPKWTTNPTVDSTPKAPQPEPREEVLREVNRVRAEFRMTALRLSGPLGLAAGLHATDMAERGYREHASPEGCTLFDRAVGFLAYPSGGVAENLAEGPSTAKDVVASWMGSEGHKANILHPEYTEMGVARVQGRDGKPYWAQVFGDGDTSPAALRGELGCPEGFVPLRLTVGPAAGELPVGSKGPALGAAERARMCVSPTEGLGPFTEEMRVACRKRGVPPDTCLASRWERALFLTLRGRTPCPPGARRDPDSGYCLEGGTALGPFPAVMREICHAQREEEAARCDAQTWPAPWLKNVWRQMTQGG